MTMRKKKQPRKRKETRTGSRRGFLAAALFAPAVAFGEKKPKKKAEPEFATVAGTVFRDPGFALRGAGVTLAPDDPASKMKPLKSVSDSRGEYAFHVPPGPARYTVSVKVVGLAPQSKPVSIVGLERVDVYFQLQPAAK